jgi:hypothetical protein
LLSRDWKTIFILVCCAGWPVFFSGGHNLYFLEAPSWKVALDRAAHSLDRDEGKHLVIVRYGAKHSYHLEFVYNEADLSGAKVIWAREMGEAKDRELLRYFKDRKAWLLDWNDDRAAPRLIPYVLSQSAGKPHPGKESPA